jgi:Toprim-like
VRASSPLELDPAVASYAQRCAQLLWTDSGSPIRRWLYGRGFHDDVLHVNQIGADPGRRALPRPRGLPAGDGLAATFPALDTTGTVRYVQTRYLTPRPGQPKYDNPAARLGANPRPAWLAPPVPRHEHDLVICEGIPDALTAAQAGYRSVATLGTHAADHHVARALAEHANAHGLTLTAVVDADPPGRAAGKRLATLLAAHRVTLRIVEPPDGLDLNGWAQRDPSWPSALTHLNPTVSRPRALVRHELLTALRLRAAHTARPAPTDRHGRMMIADNERQISRLEAELDQHDDHPSAQTRHPTVSPDPGIEI